MLPERAEIDEVDLTFTWSGTEILLERADITLERYFTGSRIVILEIL